MSTRFTVSPCHLVTVSLLLAVGCQPAVRYETHTQRAAPKTERPPEPPRKPEPVNPKYGWRTPDPRGLLPDTRIEFVHKSSPERWNELKQFWTVTELPSRSAVLPSFLMSPALEATLAAATRERMVRIKVPAGLWDPSRWNYLPAANPPTLNKWALGKRLFFDDSWLLPRPQKLSCARCHDPARGFSDGLPAHRDRMHPPTLINAMYNEHQFWDGRADRLEEVVLRSLEDERPGEDDNGTFDADRRHVWPGVIHRLMADSAYNRRFRQVFGTPPTADALGKALATYLRTILTGNSIYDRAVREAGGKPLIAAHFEKVLDKPTIETLDKVLQGADIGADRLDVNKPADVARNLFAGWQLFEGKGKCTACHTPPHNFHDDGFHNLGIREALLLYDLGQEPGRFGALPVGLKDPAMIGAFKTPTLRALPRTAPYFHDGSRRTLVEVVGYHAQGGRRNPSLDPLLRDPSGQPRRLGLSDAENRLLVLFLMALDGDPIDPMVADPKMGLEESQKN